MIRRKRKILFIQFIIFLFALTLLYNTYRDKNKPTKEAIKVEAKTDPNTNSFDDIEYSGFDLNGNRYILKAEEANFRTEKPEVINMKNVIADFYLKDGSVLAVTSKEGLYNNVTLDMEFRQNVKAIYSNSVLFADQLNYSNTNSNLLASGNVRGESVEKGEFFADNVEYDISNKTLNFSMSGDKKVNIKIKN